MKKILLFLAAIFVPFMVIGQSLTTTYEYDELNRLVKVNYPNGQRVEFTYDALGNRLSMTMTQVGYSIQAEVFPEGTGTVQGTGVYNIGSTATLTALPNEGYQFVNWTNNGVEVSTNATYSFTVTNACNLVANFETSAVTQTIELFEGWNWVSTYIEADDPVELLQMLESALGVNASQISSAELFTENDEGDWWGDLDEEGVTNDQMFMILVETPCTIELQGMPANPADHPIIINPGWNWIGFPCDYEMSIEEALGGFEAEEGDLFANSEFFTEFDGEWFGDVAVLIPGQGFMYFSNSDEPKTLIIGSQKNKSFKKP